MFIKKKVLPCNVYIFRPSCNNIWILSTGRKETFNLMTNSANFIYGYMALNIIMVKDHSDNEKGNLQHGLIFPIRERDVPPGRPSTQSATWWTHCAVSRSSQCFTTV